MRQIVFELCAERIDACLAARDGGAHRIELCSALSEGGLTPSYGLIRAAVKLSRLPVHVLIRPRSGDFVYSPEEFAIMAEDIRNLSDSGVAGVVLGILQPDRTIDIPRTRSLVEIAYPLPVSFHRAFDETPSLSQALEDLIVAGCNRVLTSGGQPDVVMGEAPLRELVLQAGTRIDVAAGGGLHPRNAAAVASGTGAHHFHGSLRYAKADRHADHLQSQVYPGRTQPQPYVVTAANVQAIIEQLQNA